jgi:hypothetical protein
MQSTKRNLSFSAYTQPAAEPKKPLSVDRSFLIACGLGLATTVFGFVALFNQFSAELDEFQLNRQSAAPEFTRPS